MLNVTYTLIVDRLESASERRKFDFDLELPPRGTTNEAKGRSVGTAALMATLALPRKA